MSGMSEIYKNLRQSRIDQQINEENLDEMSRSDEKDMIKMARPIVQKMAYAAGVKVKNPGQNSSRFILVGDGAKALAPSIAKAIKAAVSKVEGLDGSRIKAARVSSDDQKKYKVDGECAAVIVDAPGAADEEQDLDEGDKNLGRGLEDISPTEGDLESVIPKESKKAPNIKDILADANFKQFLVENISTEDVMKYWKEYEEENNR